MCVFDAFLICNYGVLLPWGMLIGFPRSRWTARVVHSIAIPLLLGAVYLVVFITQPTPPVGAGFTTLEGVMAFFTSPYAALAGWVHYLAFDLFIGAWEVRDAERRGIRHLYVVPCLIMTLMLGPIGLGMYLLLRLAMRGETSLAGADPVAT